MDSIYTNFTAYQCW